MKDGSKVRFTCRLGTDTGAARKKMFTKSKCIINTLVAFIAMIIRENFCLATLKADAR